MGTALLVVISAIELALMAYSLITRSHQERVRSVVRIAALVAFALCLATGIIPWGARWIGLAGLLFVQAVHGLWALRRARGRAGGYRAAAVVRRTLGALLLILVAISPALLFPPYEPLAATGPYAVDTSRYTYTDPNRVERLGGRGGNRMVNASFWFPDRAEGANAHPLVLFSHGGLGTEDSNESLYLDLASHGYVVCSVGHPYHTLLTRNDAGRITLASMDYVRELQQEDAQRDKQQSHRSYQGWMETRVGDLHLVLNTVLERAAAGASGVYGLVDGERIGVMGHSLGGSAALAIPRERDDVDAVIALESPFLYDIVGVENDAFVFVDGAYPVPVLNVYSDSAWGHLAEWPQYARNYALLTDPPATAFSVHLGGAGHLSLTDLSLASPFLVRFLDGGLSAEDSRAYLQSVGRVCLEFLDRYVKGQ